MWELGALLLQKSEGDTRELEDCLLLLEIVQADAHSVSADRRVLLLPDADRLRDTFRIRGDRVSGER